MIRRRMEVSIFAINPFAILILRVTRTAVKPRVQQILDPQSDCNVSPCIIYQVSAPPGIDCDRPNIYLTQIKRSCAECSISLRFQVFWSTHLTARAQLITSLNIKGFLYTSLLFSRRTNAPVLN